MNEPNGVVIRTWSCPVNWHRYVKWHGDDAYCIEPGCEHSNVGPPVPCRLARMVAPVPRGVITVHLPGEE